MGMLGNSCLNLQASTSGIMISLAALEEAWLRHGTGRASGWGGLGKGGEFRALGLGQSQEQSWYIPKEKGKINCCCHTGEKLPQENFLSSLSLTKNGKLTQKSKI